MSKHEFHFMAHLTVVGAGVMIFWVTIIFMFFLLQRHVAKVERHVVSIDNTLKKWGIYEIEE